MASQDNVNAAPITGDDIGSNVAAPVSANDTGSHFGSEDSRDSASATACAPFDWEGTVERFRALAASMQLNKAQATTWILQRTEAEATAHRQAAERAAEREVAAAEKAAERKHQLDLQRLEYEHRRATTPSANSSATPVCPQLRKYHPGDPLDEFIRNVEAVASMYGLSEEDKIWQLYGLLPLDLLQVINEIPEENRKSYQTIKEALLYAGHYTAEDLRLRYFQAFPTPQESGVMWGHRKMRLIKDWAARAQVTLDPAGQSTLDWLVWDQMIRLMPLELLTPVRSELQGKKGFVESLEAIDRVMASNFPTKRLCEVLHKPSSVKSALDVTAAGGSDRSKKKKHKRQNDEKTSRQNDDKTSRLDTNKTQDTAGQHRHQQATHKQQASQSRPGVHPPGQGNHHARKTSRTATDFSGNRQGSRPLTRSLHGITIQDDCQEEPAEPLVHVGSLASASGATGVPKCAGQLNGKMLSIALDTGAEGIFVDKEFVDRDQYTGEYVSVRFGEGPPVRRPVAMVTLHCAYYTGTAPVIALEQPVYPVYLGRVLNLVPSFKKEAYDHAIATWKGEGSASKAPSDHPSSPEIEEYRLAPVSTRATSTEEAAEPIPEDITLQPLCNREEFRRLQEADASLKSWWEHCRKETTVGGRGGILKMYVKRDGLLHQVTTKEGQQQALLVIPEPLRKQVLYMGHHNPLSGHFGLSKTQARIQKYFSWPRFADDVSRYVRSCHQCQLTSQARTPPQPMGITKLAAIPFSRVAVDIVGPLTATRSGKQYILTYVDMATRYPDAVPLGSIESEKVAEALLQICSRVGFPEVLTSDNGSNFTSKMFEAFLRLVEVDHIRTSVYHSMGNGTCERYNGTLIRCLRKLVFDFPRQWDKYLPAALFAYRDTPHDTTGYAPFELIYGHHVRGPLEFLKTCWLRDTLQEEDQDIHQYILKFARRLRTAWKAALDALQTSQTKSKALFDRHARRRLLRPGEKVLLLLPGDTRKMLLRWQGPYTVIKRFDPTHYSVLVNGAERKYHLNQLKRYYLREDHTHPEAAQNAVEGEAPAIQPSDISPNHQVTINAVLCHYDTPDFPLIEEEPTSQYEDELCDYHEWYGEEKVLHLATALAIEDPEPSVDDGRDPSIPVGGSQTDQDVTLAPTLTKAQREKLQEVLAAFKDVLTDTPGLTTALEHDIELKEKKPFQHKYPMPHHLQQQLKEDLKTWVELGIVERSVSPYCSPLLAVRKADGTIRFCLDCRQLNARTIFDGEPIADPAHIFSTLAPAKYLSKMDLASGFWQVPLSDRAKPLTAFSTREGLFQFRVMPFGLVNAPGNFSRLMRIVLGDLKDVAVYIDDILVHSPDFESHCQTLKEVLRRLRQYGLHLKPSKCELGFSSLQYLGHFVGEGRQAPIEEKVTAIVSLPVPRTVTQLRSFLGSVNYYQQYIPHCNVIASPLHALLKGNPSKRSAVTWTDEAERAFIALKRALAQRPVLQLVNADLPFTLQTDASDDGIGAVLLQARINQPCALAPVFYASRTLKKSERNYSVIEKEALAIYWACRKFEPYLYGRSFTLQTDHAPLVHLQTADKLNPRLKRWALYLALFAFRGEHIPGDRNCTADMLSRGTRPPDPCGAKRNTVQ